MERLLDNIERYKFAILGTILFHVVFFLCSNFVTIKRPYGVEPGDVTEIEIDATEIEISPEMIEMMQQQDPLESQEVRNMVSDENDSRERSYENFSSQSVDQQVEDEARALEQQYFEEWASTHDGDEAGASRNPENDRDNQEKRPDDNRPNETIDNQGDNAYAGVTLASYNLPNRKAHSLQVPSYKCNGSGTVVINIKVDKSGQVRDVEYNSGLSRNATDCMISNAKKYAKRSRFDYSGSASSLANGTITYKFQGQ